MSKDTKSGFVTNGMSLKKPLTAKEEAAYAAQLKSSDSGIARAASNILVEHNLRLVAHIAKKYAGQSYPQEDMMSLGTIGLIKAVNSFDPDKGIKLGTYAVRCIENAMLT